MIYQNEVQEAAEQQAYLEELASIAYDLQMEQYEDVMEEYEDDMLDEGEEPVEQPTMQQCVDEVRASCRMQQHSGAVTCLNNQQ